MAGESEGIIPIEANMTDFPCLCMLPGVVLSSRFITASWRDDKDHGKYP